MNFVSLFYYSVLSFFDVFIWSSVVFLSVQNFNLLVHILCILVVYVPWIVCFTFSCLCVHCGMIRLWETRICCRLNAAVVQLRKLEQLDIDQDQILHILSF